MLWYEIVGVV